jgi:hypothetical protein
MIAIQKQGAAVRSYLLHSSSTGLAVPFSSLIASPSGGAEYWIDPKE